MKSVEAKAGIEKYILYCFETQGKLGLDYISQTIAASLSEEIYTKITELTDVDSVYLYKANEYNLNLFGSKKIKLYLGLNATLAEQNYNEIKKHFDVDATVVDNGCYRIEIYNLVYGNTVADYIDTGSTEYTFDDFYKMFLDYVVENYCQGTELLYYPNDNNTGNFVVVENRLVNIDYDHITRSDITSMSKNTARQFFSRMPDIENLDSVVEQFSKDVLRIAKEK